MKHVEFRSVEFFIKQEIIPLKKKLNQPVVGKVSLIGLLLIFLLPFAVVVYQLLAEIDVGIKFAQKKRLGLQYNQPVRQLLEDVQQHRGMVGMAAADIIDFARLLLNEWIYAAN